MDEPVTARVCPQCSKTRLSIIAILIVLLLTGIVLLALASIQPCLFLKCHSKASQCINRSLFKGQCICDADRAGNGRTVCDECGLRFDPPSARIIGGTAVVDHSWPFVVSIRQQYKNRVSLNNRSYTISSSWMCGGTLINHRTILTAAHCVKSTDDTFEFQSVAFPIVWNEYYPTLESTLEVSVGLYDRHANAERRLVKVAQAIRHPSFDDRYLWNDIALLKLADSLRPSTTIQFACLTNSLPVVNLTGTVIGFGDTSPGENKGSLILQQVNLTVYPEDFCSDVSPTALKDWQIQLCSGDLLGERDACQGDSGGGLYIQRNVSHRLRYTLDGIVSYGERCASPMKPGIYTRVSAYIDWIRQHSDFDLTDGVV